MVDISQNLEEVGGNLEVIHVVDRERSIQQTFRCENKQKSVFKDMLVLVLKPDVSEVLA